MQQQQELNDLKLAVMLHGGTVADTYSSAVTHLVLWPVQQQQQQYSQQYHSGVLTSYHHDQQVRLPCLLEAVQLEGSTYCEQAVQLACHQQGLLPGHSGLKDIQVDQLLQQLAETAAAAADAATAAAAAAKAAAITGSSRKVGSLSHRGRSKLSVAPPSVAAAAAAAPSQQQRLLAIAETGRTASPSVADAGTPAIPGVITSLTARLAAGNKGEAMQPITGVMQGLLAEQQQAAAAAAPSPAAQKLLRQIRRRLAAAAGWSNVTVTKRGRIVAALYLVEPNWVIDSLQDLWQQQQQQSPAEGDAYTTTNIVRRSELLYLPDFIISHAAKQQQQQRPPEGPVAPETSGPVGSVEGGASGSAGISSSSDVLAWPWEAVGLTTAAGGSSSSSSGGSSSDDTPSTSAGQLLYDCAGCHVTSSSSVTHTGCQSEQVLYINKQCCCL